MSSIFELLKGKDHYTQLKFIEENFEEFKNYTIKVFENSEQQEKLNIIFNLTYYPNLIIIFEEYCIENKNLILQYKTDTGHPLLNELIEQTQIIYNLNINDEFINSIREKFKNFILNFKKNAPEYFSLRGKYYEYPVSRFNVFNEQEKDTIDFIKRILTPIE